MDFQNRPGGKTGTFGVASKQQEEINRRERLRKLALVCHILVLFTIIATVSEHCRRQSISLKIRTTSSTYVFSCSIVAEKMEAVVGVGPTVRRSLSPLDTFQKPRRTV